MQVNLVYFRPDGERKDIPLHGSEVLLGRAEDCNLRIPLASVSRQHCRVIIGDGEVILEDLGSANGTLVNGEKVSREILSAGDKLTVGQAIFIVQIDGKPKKIKPPVDGVGSSAAVETAPAEEMLAPAEEADVVEVAESESSEIDNLDAAPSTDAEVAVEAEAEAAEVEAEVQGGEEAVVDVEEVGEEAAVASPASASGDAEVLVEEDAVAVEDASGADGAAEVAVDLESVEGSNDGAGSSSVEDILLELEAAEEEEAKKKH
jgi:pSer/pThr/pTyr-binding forkhead associated (FHA) protein